jgi:HlyD family secretion protein
MMKRIIIASATILIALAGLALSPFFLENQTKPDRMLVSGNIEAHESVVSFKAVESRITELPFDEGQWVHTGTLLARLDDSDYRQQVVIDQAQIDVYKRQLDSARQRVDAAGATVASDKADLAQRRLDYDRNQQLFDAHVISPAERDKSETALKQSRAALERDLANQGVTARDVAVAIANIHDAQEKLKLANIDLGYTVLNAPFSGVILTRQAELGEVMQPGTPVVTMADLDHVWLRAYVAETDLGRVRLGQPALISTDSYPGKKYRGHISFIASDAEFTPKSVETHKERVTLVYRIKIDLENPRHELKPGMPADAAIEFSALAQQAQR